MGWGEREKRRGGLHRCVVPGTWSEVEKGDLGPVSPEPCQASPCRTGTSCPFVPVSVWGMYLPLSSKDKEPRKG